MIKNILAAEFYKEYSKKSTFIVPISICILLFSSLSLILGNIKLNGTMTQSNSIMIIISGLFFISVFSISMYIIPIIIPIIIITQDYVNNVLSNLFSTNISRSKIFWSKVIVITVLEVIYFTAITISILIPILFFLGTNDTIQQFINIMSFINIDLPFTLVDLGMLLLNSIINFAFIISAAIFSSIVAKRIAGAIGLIIAIYILKNTISSIITTTYILSIGTDSYFTSYNTDGIGVTILNIILLLTLNILLFGGSYLMFIKKDY